MKTNITLKALITIALAYTISMMPAYSQQIITDGQTSTTVNTVGNHTTVTTTTIHNNSAFNSLERLDIDSGNRVDFIVPDSVDNLIITVSTDASVIDGILNSIKNGDIGGNVYIVNPHGAIVGSSGIVNDESLAVITPTQDFIDNFYTSMDNPDPLAVDAVLNDTVEINPAVTIDNQGSINVINNVLLSSHESRFLLKRQD